MNKNNIDKPLIIAYKECKDGIVELINNSSVPPFLIEVILNDLITENNKNVQIEYKNAIDAYRKQLNDSDEITVDKDDIFIEEE